MIDLYINRPPSRVTGSNIANDRQMFNIAYSAMSIGLSKSRTWISRMVRAGFIADSDGFWEVEKNELYLTQLFAVMDVLDSHYDEWEMHIQPLYSTDIGSESDSGRKFVFSLTPFVIYDDFTITNSTGQSHPIEKLIVALPMTIEEGNLCPEVMMGTRLTISSLEYSSGYLHSHLNSRRIQKFNSLEKLDTFCIGGSSELHDLIMEMRAVGTFDAGLFDLYFTMVDTAVKWESLEGVPYFKITKLLDKRVPELNPSTMRMINYVNDKLENQLLHEIQESKILKYYVQNDRYKIHPDSLKTAIGNITKTIFPTEIKNFFCKENGGRHYAIPDSEEDFNERYVNNKFKIEQEAPYFYFCGRKKYFKVVEQKDKKKYSLDDYEIHPKLIDYVITRFEQKLYEQAVRRGTAQKYRESIDA
jgi:hypothetical protein